ncbi:unnamed protein product, partial [Brassica oleracea]
VIFFSKTFDLCLKWRSPFAPWREAQSSDGSVATYHLGEGGFRKARAMGALSRRRASRRRATWRDLPPYCAMARGARLGTSRLGAPCAILNTTFDQF